MIWDAVIWGVETWDAAILVGVISVAATSGAAIWARPPSAAAISGRGDLGGGRSVRGDPKNRGGELDFETASDLARTPPNEFRACVIGTDCATQASPLHRVRVDWTTPNVGGASRFVVYRVPGPTLHQGSNGRRLAR